MEVAEMFRRVLLESGQFLLEINGIELDRDRFVVLCKSALGTFNKYDPIEKKFNLDMRTSKTFTFDDDSDPCGIPEWISSVTPVQLTTGSTYNPSSITSVGGLMSYFGSRGSNPYLEEKCTFPIDYRKPTLYLPVEELVDVHAVYFHKFRDEIVEGKKFYYIDTIDHGFDEWFQLLRARFMIAIGRSRRAFTLQDISITTDADQLVAEGKELERETVEWLYENSGKQYLSYG